MFGMRGRVGAFNVLMFYEVDRCLARYSPRAEANNSIACNTMQWNLIPYDNIRYNAIQDNTMQYHKVTKYTIRYNEMECNTIQIYRIA